MGESSTEQRTRNDETLFRQDAFLLVSHAQRARNPPRVAPRVRRNVVPASLDDRRRVGRIRLLRAVKHAPDSALLPVSRVLPYSESAGRWPPRHRTQGLLDSTLANKIRASPIHESISSNESPISDPLAYASPLRGRHDIAGPYRFVYGDKNDIPTAANPYRITRRDDPAERCIRFVSTLERQGPPRCLGRPAKEHRM